MESTGEQQEKEQHNKNELTNLLTLSFTLTMNQTHYLFTTNAIASCKPDQTTTPTTSLPRTPTPATTPTTSLPRTPTPATTPTTSLPRTPTPATTPTTSLPRSPTPATTQTSASYYTDYGNEREEVSRHPHGQKLLLQNDPRHEEDEGRLAGEQRDDVDVVELLETKGAQERVAAEHPQTREHRHLPEHGCGAGTRSLLPVHREPLPGGNKHICTHGN